MAKDTTGRLRVTVKSGGRLKLSSKLWLERQLNDPYVAQAKRDGLRSRAAYKLIEIDDKHHFLKSGITVVDLGAAPGGWSQIAAKRVGAAAHHRQQFFRRAVGKKIELRKADADDLRHFQQIDRDDLAPSVGRTDTLGGDLAPAAGCCAEIDHRDAGFQEVMLVVDLDQLVGRPRAQAVPLGLRHIGIVELPLQPEF